MSDTAPREATPPRWAAPSLIALIFLNQLGFGIVVPLLPFYAKSFNAPAWLIALIFSAFSIGTFFGEPYLFLKTRDLTPTERQGVALRVFTPSPGSSPSSPRGVFAAPDLARAFNGVLFIDQARPATPL